VNGVNGVMGVEGYGSSEGIQGPYNACAPNPETMSELAAVMGRVMNRPSLFKVPGFALRIVLGEVASSILASLRVYPKRLTDAGFTFAFDDLEEALAEIL
jgi:NAD dependent epimerase/dehydratase family enzyme